MKIAQLTTDLHRGAAVHDYRYWLLRYVPNTTSGEFVNVGLIVGAGDDWTVRTASNYRHMSRLGGNAELIRPWLDRIRATVESGSPSTLGVEPDNRVELHPSRFDDLAIRYNNSVRIHPGGPVETSNSASTADLLFDLLVEDPEPAHRPQRRTQVRNVLDRRLDQWKYYHPASEVLTKPTVTTGKVEQEFDHLVTPRMELVDSTQWHLTYAWSFEYSNPRNLKDKIFSWAYSVARLRDHGGAASVKGSSVGIPVSSATSVSVLYQPPKTNEQNDVFEMALESFAELQVAAYPLDRTEDMLKTFE